MTMFTATTPRDIDAAPEYQRRCAVPPYLLEHLSRHRPPAAIARTLELDEQVRERRHRGALPERALVAPAGTLDRTISDAENTEELPGRTVRTEGQPPVQDVSVNEAYDGIGSVHAFLEEVYRQSSLDGTGLGLLATVHYGQRYDNAFWDGTQMVFGDGDGEVFTGFTPSVSVIAHELAHGLMQYSTDLLYEGQSGALNESFSDVLGALVDQYAQGQTAEQANWLIGSEVFGEGVQADGLRSMAAPGTAYDDPRLGRDPQPAHMDDYVETQADYGGVHLNSGIPNKAFHLAAMALGGYAWERAGQVWFDVVTGETLPRDADFAGFAEATVLTAGERFDEAVATAIRGAWEQVGVLAVRS
ncbi:M4 family metallopeptidase [Citricoccus nitrophenolicus]